MLASDVDVTSAVTWVVSVNEAVASVLVVPCNRSGIVIVVEVRSVVVSGVITVVIVLTAAGMLVKTCAELRCPQQWMWDWWQQTWGREKIW